MTKCPHCGKLISRLNLVELPGYVGGRSTFRCVSYNCPFCFSSISVQIDPIAIRADILKKLKP